VPSERRFVVLSSDYAAGVGVAGYPQEIGVTLLFLGLAVWTLTSGFTWRWWVPRRLKVDERTWDVYINDIRAMNEYNAHFMEGIVIFLAVAVVGSEIVVYEIGLVVLLVAFMQAALAMFFLPLPRVQERDPSEAANDAQAQYGRAMSYVKRKWVYTIILSQGTVIFTSTGVLGIIVNFIQLPER
jgi:hypothetical protein